MAIDGNPDEANILHQSTSATKDAEPAVRSDLRFCPDSYSG
jgi:hypothetical protein